MRIAFDVFIFKEPLGVDVLFGEADDDAMDGGFYISRGGEVQQPGIFDFAKDFDPIRPRFIKKQICSACTG